MKTTMKVGSLILLTAVAIGIVMFMKLIFIC